MSFEPKIISRFSNNSSFITHNLKDMRIQKLIFTAFLAVLAAGLAAKPPADRIGKKPSKAATYRAECANSESQVDQ